MFIQIERGYLIYQFKIMIDEKVKFSIKNGFNLKYGYKYLRINNIKLQLLLNLLADLNHFNIDYN